MRDLIWTIIVVWVIWRLIDAFRSISATRHTQSQSTSSTNNYSENNTSSQAPKRGELKDDAGEYVDFEEVK